MAHSPLPDPSDSTRLPPPGSPWRTLLPILVLLGLGLLATGSSLGNGFAYDDVFIIQTNAHIHHLAAPWTYAAQNYWPTSGDLLYRPLTVWLFALQWMIGGGSPLVFHLANVVLHLLTVIVLYRLALRLIPPLGAWFTAALFAVHPVHAEAVANVVGQAELVVGLVAVVGTVVYLDGRRAGALTATRRLVLAALVVAGALAKEQGLMLPLLLAVVEVTVIRDPRPLGARLRELAPLATMLAAAGLLVIALRTWAIGGLAGGMQAVAIRDTTVGHRALTMLAVVPHWVRLLVWPAHLQADYSPAEISAAASFGRAQLLGVAVVGAWALALYLSWRRRRHAGGATALGLGWTAVALLPVSNVLLPTGIVLAERTLYLPSAGACLLAGTIVVAVQSVLVRRRSAMWLGAVGSALLLGVAAWRSSVRQPVWRDNDTLLTTTVLDAPKSYRARWQLARHLAGRDEFEPAREAFRQALDRYPHDPRLLEDYGQLLRRMGRCAEAVRVLQQALIIDSTRVMARSRLYYCLIQLGRPADAGRVAQAGVALGDSAFGPLVDKADSAAATAGRVP